MGRQGIPALAPVSAGGGKNAIGVPTITAAITSRRSHSGHDVRQTHRLSIHGRKSSQTTSSTTSGSALMLVHTVFRLSGLRNSATAKAIFRIVTTTKPRIPMHHLLLVLCPS